MLRLQLLEPSCPHGYTGDDLEKILGDREDDFWYWMRGQTIMLCDGSTYDHDDKQYYTTECNTLMLPRMPVKREEIPLLGGHGGVVYRSDLERYLSGLPVID